ncbi:hypothetical protein DFH09DRAFT_1051553 [Mycena vulgaris]|nr:hypothetical protein DFH09DRAFT_1051553 [Mycena vulgaris]
MGDQVTFCLKPIYMPPYAQTSAAQKTKGYCIGDFRHDKERHMYKCRICPIGSSGERWFETRHLSTHAKTARHVNARKQRDLDARKVPSARGNTAQTEEPLNASTGTSSGSGAMQGEANGGTSQDEPSHPPHTTDFSPDPILDYIPDPQDDVPVQVPAEFSRLGWTDSAGRRVLFTAGRPETDPLAESLARALRRATGETLLPEDELPEREDIDDPLYCDGDEPDITAEELNTHLFGPDADSDWFPYPDKAMFLTDVLFSSPRLRFSRAQQKAVLSWARDLGADVPTYDSFRNTQAALLAEVGDPTVRQESGRDTIWYMNEIGDSIKKDMANPFTREGMVFYPEDGGNKMGQVWNGDKMLRDIPDHLLSPTIRHQGVIYYVNELVKRSENRWFLPKRWLTRSGNVMLASGYHVKDSDDGLVVDDSVLHVVEVSSFEANFLQILDETSGIFPLAPQSIDFADEMPHPLRAVAGSRLVYSVPLVIFIDDVSGNKSKQWNKHFSCYMSNGALPRTKLENEFHVRFVATSPFATPLEIMQGVRRSIECVYVFTPIRNRLTSLRTAFKDPIVAWDCEAHEEVLLRPYGLLFAGDNPMHAELCSCAGLNSNFFCRTCHAGGTREWKQSDEGFAEILKAAPTRDPAETAEETFQQILTSLEPNVATTLTEAIRLSGIKDTLAQPIMDALVKMGQDLRKANPDGSSYSPDEVQTILTEELKKHQQKGEGITNPLFDMDGVNMHKDTPTEILHTILLGVVKYYWGQTIWLLEKGKDFALFQTRLNSILEDGLNVPKIQADYMCQYKGGLIGKHFKTLSQVMAFAVQGLVPQDVLEAWLILGRLTVLLWHTEIENINTYTTELETCINDFINITCKCSPSILISKPKFHFLLHLPFFIRRFGPAVLFSTERYEAYNAVFRACSIYSNRLTPSRDIAWSFAGIDRVKHVVTGGWWRDSKSKKWVCAKPRVMRHILNHPEFAAMVGLPTKQIREPGTITYYPVARKREDRSSEPIFLWNQSLAGRANSGRFMHGEVAAYKAALGVVTCTGDKALVGQNVVIRKEGGSFSPLSFATIREILTPIPFSERGVRITVQTFDVQPNLHSVLRMPVLTRSPHHEVLLTEDIESTVNLQHDCADGKCDASGRSPVIQEREKTSKSKAIIKHTDDHRFVLNTCSLHNYHQIASATPIALRLPSFSVEDQPALRAAAAARIREKGTGEEEPDLEPLLTLDSTEEQASTETNPIPHQSTTLANPAFSRIRPPRARLQPPPPTILYADTLI